MEEGDVLILYTDGIIETENSTGELFGLGRLCSILNEQHAASPREIVDAVLREVAAFRGAAPQEDDVAMIVVKIV